jgi:hypothetical protein
LGWDRVYSGGFIKDYLQRKALHPRERLLFSCNEITLEEGYLIAEK